MTEPNSPTSSPPLSPTIGSVGTAAEVHHDRRERLKSIFRPIIRVILAVLAVLGALIMPSFESILSLLGSCFAVAMTLIIPVCAGANVFGWKKLDYFLVGFGITMAVVGTGCVLLSQLPDRH